MAYLWMDGKPPKIKEVPKYVLVPDYIDVMPPLPECANFNFNPKVSGMSGDDFLILTAKLYQWGASCSTAVAEASKSD